MSTLLKKALQIDNLRQAWNEVAENKGSPGTDNISIRVWQRNWEERLIQLAQAVRSNQYRPARLRKRRIPKTISSKWRTLHIPSVTDRVLQRAVLQQLYPIYEPKFLDGSFGYRPGRSLKDAVRHISHLRRQGYSWVLDADIDNFFHEIDHALLCNFLRQDLPDDSLLPLIQIWLKADQITPHVAKGIPMGSPLSPILANLYLHRLDQYLAQLQYPLIRYADDFIVLTHNQMDCRQSYDDVEECLQMLHLRYQPAKTQITTFAQGFDFLGVHFEEGYYWYSWEGKRIEVQDDQTDWLFSGYGPDYQ